MEKITTLFKTKRYKKAFIKLFLLCITIVMLEGVTVFGLHSSYQILKPQFQLYSIYHRIKNLDAMAEKYENKAVEESVKADAYKIIVSDAKEEIKILIDERDTIMHNDNKLTFFSAKDGNSWQMFILGFIIILIILIMWTLFFYNRYYNFFIKTEMCIIRYIFILLANLCLHIQNFFIFLYSSTLDWLYLLISIGLALGWPCTLFYGYSFL